MHSCGCNTQAARGLPWLLAHLQTARSPIECEAAMAAAKGALAMAGDDEEYVYDDESGEWMPASELAARRAAVGTVEVRDAVGNLLADGDQVTLIKDLEVKGAGQTQIGRAHV